VSIAFFDLDRTLLAVNSASLWIQRELRAGNLRKVDAFKAAAWVALYQLGFGDIEQVIERAVMTLAGKSEVDIQARSLAFFQEEVQARVRPGGLRVLDQHRESGHQLVLLTSSSPYLAAPIAKQLGLDGYLSNSFEVQSGAFTGRVIRPLCFGRGKVDHARRFAKESGVGLEACAFYPDSYSDLPMLEAVGEPVAVHPDPRLARAAKKRGWPIVDWDV
jgi:HAD superfamily hydrolase (TIGR01490 family)